jgi:NAD-dependent aldehyde dehydrogenases
MPACNDNYPDVQLLINGEFKAAQGGDTLPVINPASGETIGQHAHARQADLEAALDAADAGFKQWRAVPRGQARRGAQQGRGTAARARRRRSRI